MYQKIIKEYLRNATVYTVIQKLFSSTDILPKNLVGT